MKGACPVTCFRILHISDLHARGNRESEAWRRRRVLGDNFWRNLDELQQDGNLDIVCFTGDLADWGQSDEYESAGTLLTELLARLSIPKKRLFLVPGNHDIARSVARDVWSRARQELLRPDAQTAASRWLAGRPAPHGLSDEVRDAILQRQRAYRAFLSSFGLAAQQPESSTHGRLGYRITLQLPSKPFDIHIIGLDSAWLSGDDSDPGKLLLTEDQVMRLCTDAAGDPLSGVRIALIHHPLTDLADGAHCRRLLAAHTDLLLRGHLHSTESESWADPDSRLIQLAAGCLYEGHSGDTHPNACQTISIDVDEHGSPLRYDLRLRAFSPRGGHWHDDNSLYRAAKDGRLSLGSDGRVIDNAEPRHFLVPIVENQYFTGRAELLAALVSALTTQGMATVTQPQALSGLGGVGKTQLALAYALRERHRYQAVLWVRAGSEDSLRSGFAELAVQLGLPGAKESRALDESVAQIRHWLEKTERTLLVCDGADSPEILRQFLPRRGCGHILITSRAHDFQSLGIVKPVEVVELSLPDAIEFLLRRTARTDSGAGERAAAEALAQDLGRLPLALEQAAAYVVGKAVSFADYLASYKRHRLRLLNRSEPLIGEYPDTVATTWHLNFEEVKRSPPAVALLRFSSFLAADAIPTELLIEGAPLFDPKLARVVKDAKADPVVIGELLEPLLRFSLIRRDRDANTISIHRMVQEVVKDSIHPDSRREYAWRVVQALSTTFPDPAIHTLWPQCERFLRHALAATQLCDEYRIEGEVAAHLYNQVALYLDHRLQQPEAERLFRRAIALRQQIANLPHSSLQNRVCLTVNLCNLASLLEESGRISEAEAPITQAVQLLEEKEGSDSPHLAFPLRGRANWLRHSGRYLEIEPVLQRAWQLAQINPETLLKCGGEILTALAVNALDLGKLELAEKRFTLALTICKELYGPDSPEYSQVQLHHGRLQRDQGKYQDAEGQNREALSKIEQIFGREHPHYANAAGTLARALIERGKYLEAKGLLEEARNIWTSLSGAEHVELPNTLEDIATCHRHLAQYAEAAALGEEALRLAEAQRGSDAPALWSYLNELGLTYLEQDRYDDADRSFRRAVRLVHRGTGENSLSAATLHNNLALVYEAQGQYQDALKEYELSLRIAEKRLGGQHPETCLTLHNIAQAYARIGRYSDAKPIFERALAGWRQAYGSTHNKVAVCLYGLAFVNMSLGDAATAEQQLLEACSISERVLPPNHPDLAQSVASLGEHFRARGRYSDALPYYERALVILRQSEPHSMLTASIESVLGATLSALDKHAEAESMLRDAVARQEAKVGSEHPRLSTPLTELAVCLIHQGRKDEAENCLLRALKLIEGMPNQGGPLHARALSNLAHLRKEQGRIEEAAKLEAQVVEIRERTLGGDHPDVALSYGVLSELAILRGQPDEARQHLTRGLTPGATGHLQTVHALRMGHTQLELGDYKAATTTLKDALRAAEEEYGRSSKERLIALHELAATQLERGELSGAGQSLQAAEDLLEHLPNIEPSLRLSFAQAKAGLLRHLGRLGEAKVLLEQALKDGEVHRADPACVVQRILMLNNLAGVLEGQRAVGEATAFYETAQKLLAGLQTGRRREELEFMTLSNLANNLRYLGQDERAGVLFKHASELRTLLHGTQHPRHIVPLQQEAALARAEKDFPRAKQLLESALVAGRAEWSEEHPYWSLLFRELGEVCMELGELPAALEHLQNALAHDERIYGTAAPQLRRDLRALMNLAIARREPVAAVEYAQRAVHISRGQLSADPEAALEDEAILALRLRDTRNLVEGLAATERALEILKKFPAAASMPMSAALQLSLGTFHRDQGHIPDALSAFDAVIRIFEVNPPLSDADRHSLASAHHARGDCLFRKENSDAARLAYETSLQIRRSTTRRERGEEALTLNNLARLRVLASDLDGAETLLHEAVDLYYQAQDAWGLISVGRSYASVLGWLARKEDARLVLTDIISLAQQFFGEHDEETKQLAMQLASLSEEPIETAKGSSQSESPNDSE